jgi:hypothetical protein
MPMAARCTADGAISVIAQLTLPDLPDAAAIGGTGASLPRMPGAGAIDTDIPIPKHA